MSQEGRGCLVADQGGSDKVAHFKIEGRGSGPAVLPLDPRMSRVVRMVSKQLTHLKRLKTLRI